VEEERTSETLTNMYQNTRLYVKEDVNPHSLTVGCNYIHFNISICTPTFGICYCIFWCIHFIRTSALLWIL